MSEEELNQLLDSQENIDRTPIKERYAKLNQERKTIESQLQKINIQIGMLQDECEHPHMKDDWGTGVCPDCNYVTQGWFCKDSPTKECEYYDDETNEFNDDACIYCGNPEERK